ncbi:dCMP deaminase [Klebsormidium nitens]|uniref:dCMP deaminase n=1 Tax=Klebsormidium nitens TaxID=105231 RepID=A0A1Y1IL60_KLENI|nr:dCMP deaminase [Klebsormidium nitens]|eukprot:GAQ91403.1 dCMP deaminase [Klebsormidium nitens]
MTMEQAKRLAQQKSKDPHTKVGCLIVNDSGKVLSAGVNSFPTGVDDSPSYRWVRPTKYNYVVHAELNAIAEAASSGVSLRGATCIQTLFPCISCTKAIIQSPVYTLNGRKTPEEYLDEHIQYTNARATRLGFQSPSFRKLPNLIALAMNIASVPYEYLPMIKWLGEGAYGTAYSANGLPPEFHIAMYKDLQFRTGDPDCHFEQCVIKTALVKDKKAIDAFVRESKMQGLISLETYGPVSGKDLVPKICYAGILFGGGMAISIQVMTRAPGDTLHAIAVRQNGLTATQYVAVEKTFVSMWSLGFVHGDSHANNILYDVKNDKVTIIDAGMTLLLPFAIRDAVRSFDPARYPGLEIFARTIDHLTHGYIQDYNADGKMLATYLKWVLPEERKLVNRLRYEAWQQRMARVRRAW